MPLVPRSKASLPVAWAEGHAPDFPHIIKVSNEAALAHGPIGQPFKLVVSLSRGSMYSSGAVLLGSLSVSYAQGRACRDESEMTGILYLRGSEVGKLRMRYVYMVEDQGPCVEIYLKMDGWGQ